MGHKALFVKVLCLILSSSTASSLCRLCLTTLLRHRASWALAFFPEVQSCDITRLISYSDGPGAILIRSCVNNINLAISVITRKNKKIWNTDKNINIKYWALFRVPKVIWPAWSKYKHHKERIAARQIANNY